MSNPREYLGEGNFLVPEKKDSHSDQYMNVVIFDPTDYWDLNSDEGILRLKRRIVTTGN
jgi:hypothetical protein